MKIRIKFWPRRILTLGGRPHPEAVKVELDHGSTKCDTHRLASAPGWMLLLVTYPTDLKGTKR